jgi:hypothetical protein
MAEQVGLFHENEVVTLTGVVRNSHFYNCQLLIKGPAKIVDCTFEGMDHTAIEGVGPDIVIRNCLFMTKGGPP